MVVIAPEKLTDQSNTTIRYSGNGLLSVVTKNGKRPDIITGSILSQGPATGICLADTDFVARPPSVKKGHIFVQSDDSSNKKSGSSVTVGIGIGDTCDPRNVAKVGSEQVKTVSDTPVYCTAPHTGGHVVSSGKTDGTAPLGGTGENSDDVCKVTRDCPEGTGPKSDEESNKLIYGISIKTLVDDLKSFTRATFINEESTTVCEISCTA